MFNRTGESHLLAHLHTLAGQDGLTEHFIPALQEAKSTKRLASYVLAPLAYSLVSMLMRAMNRWMGQDEPGSDVVAYHILFVLGQVTPDLNRACHSAQDQMRKRNICQTRRKDP